MTDSSPLQAYDAALKIVTKRKWRVVDARPPQVAPPREGLIEAIARTPILGFRDDVVVRVRAAPEGARIDVRSASRYGRHDLGANAARVRLLIDDIDDLLATPTPEKKQPTRSRLSRPGGAIRPNDKRRQWSARHRSQRGHALPNPRDARGETGRPLR